MQKSTKEFIVDGYEYRVKPRYNDPWQEVSIDNIKEWIDAVEKESSWCILTIEVKIDAEWVPIYKTVPENGKLRLYNENDHIKRLLEQADGYYLVGKVEWNNPEYAETTTGILGSEDYLWVMTDNTMGHTIYRWVIGPTPAMGNRYASTDRPLSVIDILKYLVSSPAVPIGRTDKGMAYWKVPNGIRLQGMPEWIIRTEEEEREAMKLLTGIEAKKET